MHRKRIGFLLLVLIGFIWLIFKWEGIERWMYPLKYTEVIRENAKLQSIDPFLIAAIIRVESNFDPITVSNKGAIGMMQVMPETAKWIYRQNRNFVMDALDLNEPKQNIMLGSWYLRFLQNQFGNREAVVIAAYNAGQGTIRKWLEGGQWSGSEEELDRIPYEETRKYVKRVIFFRNQYRKLYEAELNVYNMSGNEKRRSLQLANS